MNNILFKTIQTLRLQKLKAVFSLYCVFACLHLSAAEKEPVYVANNLIKEMGSGWNLEYHENFSGCRVGEEPESLFILDGHYSVQEESKGQKYLQLPGTPMGDFGLLFGPRIKDRGLALRFSFFFDQKRASNAIDCCGNWWGPSFTASPESCGSKFGNLT